MTRFGDSAQFTRPADKLPPSDAVPRPTLQFINHEEGRVVMKDVSAPEYQYYLKDHLGNVRVTFTTAPARDANSATYEAANANVEQSKFLRYTNARRIYATIFDHTNGGSPGYSERLSASSNEIYGLARSISVMPGDVVQTEVFAKYVDTNSANWTTALNTLMGQIASNNTSVVLDGSAYTSSTSSFPAAYAGLVTKSDNGAPKAYLNWLVFDRNFVFLTGGFRQITTICKEAGTDVAHEYLSSGNITITQPGYVYIYLSNEATSPVEVFFDDFKVTQTKSPVVQSEDFYPFGATFNSYSRENSVPNKYLYNAGSELVDDLGVQIYLTDLREYDPWGRLGWWQLDPKPDKGGQESWTPYHYAFNNPIRYNDPKGDCPPGQNCDPVVKASGPSANASASNGTATAQASIAKVNVNAQDGKQNVNINVTVAGGQATATAEAKFLSVSAGAKAEAKGLAMDATYKVGSDKNNAAGTVDARLGTASANAEGSLSYKGASLSLGAGAAAGSAEGKASVTLFGVKVEVSGLVTGASAHIGAGLAVMPAEGSGKSQIGANANIGLGVGVGLGFKISY